MVSENIKGRGTPENPANRFEPVLLERDPEWNEEEPLPKTQFFKDRTRNILSRNDSPDIPFTHSLNPYRGCEHGCAYCYARPTHEYLGLSAGLDFETRIFVKESAPELLRKALGSPRWEPEMVAISGVTDPYQPAEKEFQITRKCLEVFAEFLNPVGIITKNRLVTRDIDLLSRLARANAAAVYLSITTLDDSLRRVLEPRTSAPDQRLAAIRALSQAGIPAGVMIAPVIPGLNDHEIPRILQAAANAGAQFAGYVPLRLPYGVSDLFETWLDEHRPDSKKKVMNQIRSLRGGRTDDPGFGSRMTGRGVFAEHIQNVFRVAASKAGIRSRGPALSASSFKRPGNGQLDLL